MTEEKSYRIKRDVRPHGGRRFEGKPSADGRTVTGHVITTYRNFGPYAYRAEELNEEGNQ